MAMGSWWRSLGEGWRDAWRNTADKERIVELEGEVKALEEEIEKLKEVRLFTGYDLTSLGGKTYKPGEVISIEVESDLGEPVESQYNPGEIGPIPATLSPAAAEAADAVIERIRDASERIDERAKERASEPPKPEVSKGRGMHGTKYAEKTPDQRAQERRESQVVREKIVKAYAPAPTNDEFNEMVRTGETLDELRERGDA